MRVFFSTGEASGELCATLLAGAMREHVPDLICEGNGGERMEQAGIRVIVRTTGWASLGPIAAIGRIPGAFVRVALTIRRFVQAPPDLIVLIDFGAFNVRLARLLRRFGYTRPILYCFPPAAWLDRAGAARVVASIATPLTAFSHQRDFYKSLGLEAEYYGHPLVSVLQARPVREPAAAGGGRLALLPGSRDEELKRHLPVMREAIMQLRVARPHLEIVVVAADSRIAARLEAEALPGVRIERGTRTWLEWADAALIASGTAVLEAALLATPCVAMYIVGPLTARIARRVYHGPYVTLPNLVLGRMAVPELLQEAATGEAVARSLATILDDPAPQLAALRDLRRELGESGALEAWAQVALRLAQT